MSRPTRIVINGRFLDRAVTGVQRYGLEICRALDVLLAERHAAVSDLAFEIARPSAAASEFPFRHIGEARFGRLRGHLWEQLELPLHAGSDLVLNLCNLCPLLARRNLTVVHDANAWLIPDNYSWLFRSVQHVLLPRAIRRSQAWITVSRYSAEKLQHFGVADRPPAAIIGNGADHLALDGKAAVPAARALPANFVFALGSRSRNKNLHLIYALAPRLAERGLSIVIAGDSNPKVFGREAEHRQANVRELGRVDDAVLTDLYRRCLCFLFPSFYEGFGIPPLEAMALGAPVVASDSSSLPEVLGDAALLCPPTNPDAWVLAIEQLRSDGGIRTALTERGRIRAAQYKWTASAVRMAQLARETAA